MAAHQVTSDELGLAVRGSTWCFDCDGTILDTSATFEAAHTQAVVALGGTPVRNYWRRRRAGESEETLFAAAGLPGSEFTRYERLKQQVFDTCPLIPAPLPAARPLIGRLWSSGAEVVVISHRPSVDSLVSDLANAGLLRFMSTLYATKAPRSAGGAPPNPRTAKAEILKGFAARRPTVMVGDSVSDIAAAEAIPIGSIGVATGCCSMSRLAAAGATWVMPSLSDLYATLFNQHHI
jgi:phosphoglycolate phosphatase-like HAD superfamily hydrolase